MIPVYKSLHERWCPKPFTPRSSKFPILINDIHSPNARIDNGLIFAVIVISETQNKVQSFVEAKT